MARRSAKRQRSSSCARAPSSATSREERARAAWPRLSRTRSSLVSRRFGSPRPGRRSCFLSQDRARETTSALLYCTSPQRSGREAGMRGDDERTRGIGPACGRARREGYNRTERGGLEEVLDLRAERCGISFGSRRWRERKLEEEEEGDAPARAQPARPAPSAPAAAAAAGHRARSRARRQTR